MIKYTEHGDKTLDLNKTSKMKGLPSVRVDSHGAWITIILNRPDRLNALNDEMHHKLANALDGANKESCRAVLITGEGSGFCAGQDLTDRMKSDKPHDLGEHDLGETVETFYNPLVRQIRALQKPVICAVNGVAAGAGANIALACDIVIAARSARFIQSFIKIGLVPDSGGTFFLPRLIGDARAMALALTGDVLSAEKAEEWGLIWKTVDDEKLLIEAKALTAHLASQPTQGLALIKEALHASSANDLDRQLNLERDLQRRAGQTPDYAEGVRAFIEKRLASFTGKLK